VSTELNIYEPVMHVQFQVAAPTAKEAHFIAKTAFGHMLARAHSNLIGDMIANETPKAFYTKVFALEGVIFFLVLVVTFAGAYTYSTHLPWWSLVVIGGLGYFLANALSSGFRQKYLINHFKARAAKVGPDIWKVSNIQ
jgi:hypothetical protein